MFHVTTEARQRRSQARDIGTRAAQAGVVNNQANDRRLSAHALRVPRALGCFPEEAARPTVGLLELPLYLRTRRNA
jgi:hypothetical protein